MAAQGDVAGRGDRQSGPDRETKLCRQPELAPLERAALVRQIASASTERDKVLAKLGIDKPESLKEKYTRQMAERQATRAAAQLGLIPAKLTPAKTVDAIAAVPRDSTPPITQS